jgi:hypothetical protein
VTPWINIQRFLKLKDTYEGGKCFKALKNLMENQKLKMIYQLFTFTVKHKSSKQ